MTAEHAAAIFMGYDTYVYGHQWFNITDSLLFKFGTKTGIHRAIQIGKFSMTEQRMVAVEICAQVWVSNSQGQLVGCPPGDPNCNGGHYQWQCTTFYDWEDDDWDGGGGGTGWTPPSSGGGGGGSGDPWNTNPCRAIAGTNPCSGGGNTGWNPMPVIDAPTMLPGLFSNWSVGPHTTTKINNWKANNINRDSLDPCLKKVMDKIWMLDNGLSTVGIILSKMDENANLSNNLEKFKVTYRTVPSSNYANGRPLAASTVDSIGADGTVYAVIEFSDSVMQHATDLYAAQSFMHETIHAYLGSILLRIDAGFTIQQFNQIGYDSLFTRYINFMLALRPEQVQGLLGTSNQLATEHSYMAQDLLNMLAQALAGFDNNTLEPSYYWQITWGGLMKSRAMRTFWPNYDGYGFNSWEWPPANPSCCEDSTYGLKYALTLNRLDSIRNSVRNEQEGNSNAKGRPRIPGACY